MTCYSIAPKRIAKALHGKDKQITATARRGKARTGEGSDGMDAQSKGKALFRTAQQSYGMAKDRNATPRYGRAGI